MRKHNKQPRQNRAYHREMARITTMLCKDAGYSEEVTRKANQHGRLCSPSNHSIEVKEDINHRQYMSG